MASTNVPCKHNLHFNVCRIHIVNKKDNLMVLYEIFEDEIDFMPLKIEFQTFLKISVS